MITETEIEEETNQTPEDVALEFRDLFSVGDLVQHRASGRIAVIEEVHHRCTNPAHTMGLHCISKNGGNCNRRPVDIYDLSVDFGEILEGVPGILLQESA